VILPPITRRQPEPPPWMRPGEHVRMEDGRVVPVGRWAQSPRGLMFRVPPWWPDRLTLDTTRVRGVLSPELDDPIGREVSGIVRRQIPNGDAVLGGGGDPDPG
jgi:hypothetical protein